MRGKLTERIVGMWYVASNMQGMQVDDSVCIEGTLDLRTSAVSSANQISMRSDGMWPMIMVQGCVQMEGGVLNVEGRTGRRERESNRAGRSR